MKSDYLVREVFQYSEFAFEVVELEEKEINCGDQNPCQFSGSNSCGIFESGALDMIHHFIFSQKISVALK